MTEVVEHQRWKGEPPRDHREGVVVVARAEDRAARGRDLDLGGGRRIARRFVREPWPRPGPEPWCDSLDDDYARPWDALAAAFARAGDAARARENAARAEQARSGR